MVIYIYIFFFANGPNYVNKIQASTMQPLKTLKTWPTGPLRKQPSNLWMLLVRLRKKLESFVSENVLIGQSFSKWKCLVWCPHSRSQKTHGILFWESEIETFITKDLIQLKAQRSFSLSLWSQVCLVPVLRFPVPLGQFTSVTYARRTGGKAGNIFFPWIVKEFWKPISVANLGKDALQ